MQWYIVRELNIMAFSIDGVLMFSMDGMDADITFSSNRWSAREKNNKLKNTNVVLTQFSAIMRKS